MHKPKTRNTIYDVARHAGVAISTVSRVLNSSAEVSEPTRARVLRAIEELQFRPDRTAKRLAHRPTPTLAVAMPSFTMPFHNELLKGIRHRLREQELDLLLCDLGSTAQHQRLLSFLKRGTVDGLLLVGVPIEGRTGHELQALHAPVILIGAEAEEFDSFSWDDRAGAEAAIRHLLEQGHRRIGHIAAHPRSLVQDARTAGYKSALEAAGVPFDPARVAHGETQKHAGFSEEAGYEAMQQLLTDAPNLTAVFASSDVQALGAWKALRDAGRAVPDDVALVGYDDIKSSHYIGLTSVDQSMHRVGEEAAELLLARVVGDEEKPAVARRIIPRLVPRESSRKTLNPDG